MGENWIEELRRNLYECFYMCYDFAFKKKCLFIPVSCEILKFIENKMILFVTQGINTGMYCFNLNKNILLHNFS